MLFSFLSFLAFMFAKIIIIISYWTGNRNCKDKCFSHVSVSGFPVAQLVEHGTSNAKIMGSIPRESKS